MVVYKMLIVSHAYNQQHMMTNRTVCKVACMQLHILIYLCLKFAFYLLRGSRETLQSTPTMVSAGLTKEEDQRTQKKEENTKRACPS